MYRIEIDDIIGNAFYSYLEKRNDRRIKMITLNKFAAKIVNKLVNEGHECILDISRDKTNWFFDEYESFFTLDNDTVILSEYVCRETLCEKFSGCLALDVIIAFRDKECISVLFE